MTSRRLDPGASQGPVQRERGAAAGGGRGSTSSDASADSPRASLDRATRRGLVLIGAVALIGCLQVLFMIGVELDRTIRHRASITSLEGELTELAREAADLRAIEERAHDDTYREQLARGQGFMYPNETRVVVLPSPSRPTPP